MLACTLAFCGAVHARELELASPDGSLHLTVHVGERIGCTPQAGGRTLIPDWEAALSLADRTLGENPRLRRVKRSSVDELLPRTNPTKGAEVRNRYNGLLLEFAGDYALEFRLFDDGAAYRFVTSLPGEIEVRDECCRIGLEPGAEAWVSSVGGFRTMYEEPYTRVALSEADDAERMTYLCWPRSAGISRCCWPRPTCAITPACFFTATDRGPSRRVSRECRPSTAPMVTGV